MIKPSVDRPDFDQAFVPYTLEFCSESCCLKQAPASARAATHGRFRQSVALIDRGSIWINLRGGTHSPHHPLAVDPEPLALEARQELVTRLLDVHPPHVVPVEAVCHCSYRMAVVPGLPLVDDETRPAWHRLASRPGTSVDAVSELTWRGFLRVMADLAEGLDAMHAAGIVHHDPFAFNAMRTDDGAGVWIDLNDCRPLSERLRAADIVGFLIYTFIHVAERLPGRDWHSIDAVVRSLATVSTGDYLKVLVNLLRSTLDTSTSETMPGQSDTEPEVLWLTDLQSRPDELGAAARKLLAQGTVRYFDEYRRLRVVAANRQRQLRAEAIRHHVVEREIQRTMAVGHNQEIGAIKAWVAELERGKQWLEGQREGLLLETGRLQAQLNLAEGQHAAETEALAQLETELERLKVQDRQLEIENGQQKRENLRLEVEIERLTSHAAAQTQMQIALQAQIGQARHQAAHHASAAIELERIQATRAWMLVRLLWSWRLRLAPPGSARSRWLGRLARTAGLVRRPSTPAGAADGPVPASVSPASQESVEQLDVDAVRAAQRDRLGERRLAQQKGSERFAGGDQD